jgi:hypothetical protein
MDVAPRLVPLAYTAAKITRRMEVLYRANIFFALRIALVPLDLTHDPGRFFTERREASFDLEYPGKG